MKTFCLLQLVHAAIASSALVPSVTQNTASLSAQALNMTIAGANFSPVAASNVVTFSGGGMSAPFAVNAIAATTTSLTVPVPPGLSGSGSPALLASVTIAGVGTSATVTVATIFTPTLPVVNPSTTSVFANAGYISITGANFSTTASNNTVAFFGGGLAFAATMTATAATTTSLTVPLPAGLSGAGSPPLLAFVNIPTIGSSPTVTIATIVGFPGPTLSAAGGTGQIVLTWTATLGASSYNIYRATTMGGEGSTPYASASGTTYTDTGTGTGLASGTSYYYTVVALTPDGPSASSAEVSAITAPASPTLSAVGGKGQVVLSWAAVAGAAGYNIYRATTLGGTAYASAPYASATGTSYTDTGPLAAGATYYYALAAVNGSGSSPASAEASAITAPSSPLRLGLAAGNGQMALFWTPVMGAVSYTILRGTASGGEVSVGTSPTASYLDSGLTNGTPYYYRVAAVNSAGTSDPSSEASAAPIAPLKVIAVAFPVSHAGSLSSTSYQGSAASTTLSAGLDGWTPLGSYQDWYAVTLNAGWVYTISMQTSGNSFLSLQDAAGTQIAWNDDASLSSLGSTLASQIVFTPAATGTYTIICSTEMPATPLSYTLTIPGPSPSTPTLLPVTVPVSNPGTLGATTYQGNAASTALSAGLDGWNPAGSYQDWYSVSLIAGKTYVISLQTTGNSFLSLQDSTGAQVAWNNDAGLPMLGSTLASQIVFFTPQTSGPYTVICSTEQPATPLSYTLTIPSPDPTVTPITAPYSSTQTLTAASFFGTGADSTTGSPNGGWVNHQQNWYSLPMNASDTYAITMSLTGGTGTAVLSLQNSSGAQVACTAASPMAQITFTPNTSDTYTVICSQGTSTDAATGFTLTVSPPMPPVITTITISAPSVLVPANASVTVMVAATGTATPTGIVTLNVDNGPAMTRTLADGTATFAIASPGAGNHKLTVTYAGAPGFLPSAGTGTLTVGIPNI